MGTWTLDDLVFWACMLADPVPVRLPGVCVTGVDDRKGVSGVNTSAMGTTKMGSNLDKAHMSESADDWVKACELTGMQAKGLLSMIPN